MHEGAPRAEQFRAITLEGDAGNRDVACPRHQPRNNRDTSSRELPLSLDRSDRRGGGGDVPRHPFRLHGNTLSRDKTRRRAGTFLIHNRAAAIAASAMDRVIRIKAENHK